MERIRAMVGKYGKVYLGAVILAVICDLIGTVSINIGIGTLTMFPMVFAVILGGCLGPDALRLFNKKEAKIGGELVLVALAPLWQKWESLQGPIWQSWWKWDRRLFCRSLGTWEPSLFPCR